MWRKHLLLNSIWGPKSFWGDCWCKLRQPKHNDSISFLWQAASEIKDCDTLAARTDLESVLSLRDQKASKCANDRTLEEKNKKLMTDLKDSIKIN